MRSLRSARKRLLSVKYLSTLAALKSSSSLHDVAVILGVRPQSLAYILYKVPDAAKYKSFNVDKKGGGAREIAAPINGLKTIQRKLSRVLYECIEEIERASPQKRPLSHGFREGRSILTNASLHKRRRYVLNIDLKDFFPTFNFGRVRGFFIKNRDFLLHPSAATILAQIACHQGRLPQGSPSSPIISDLIAHILDVRLAQLAKVSKATYSRYADDLTFSSNQRIFPAQLAAREDDPGSQWVLGNELKKEIERSGFVINDSKTRMQCSIGRQMVTGLTVNTKVNVRLDHYRLARAMCDHLFEVGSYKRKGATKSGKSGVAELEGVLNFINFVKDAADRRDDKEKRDKPLAVRRLYGQLLFYRMFVALERPLVVCEGITDDLYLKPAIRQSIKFHPKLMTVASAKSASHKLSFLKYSEKSDAILRLGGGSDGLKNFIIHYAPSLARYKHLPLKHPVIVLIDNDSGANGIFAHLNSKYKTGISHKSASQFYHIGSNLYLVKTPESASSPNGFSDIEDMFHRTTLSTIVEGKKFNSSKEIDTTKEYGKKIFAEKVVRPNASKISFAGFEPLLDRLVAVIDHYKPPK